MSTSTFKLSVQTSGFKATFSISSLKKSHSLTWHIPARISLSAKGLTDTPLWHYLFQKYLYLIILVNPSSNVKKFLFILYIIFSVGMI